MNILPQYLKEHETQLDSIQKTGMSFNRKKMNGPDKWQRILQMVFRSGCLEINPDEARYISSSFTQHQGGRCSISTVYRDYREGIRLYNYNYIII